MSIYIYDLLKDFQDDLKLYYSNKKQFKNQINLLKNSDKPEIFLERFSSTNLFKKQTGDYRIIVEKILIKDTPIYCLRRIFLRSDRKYIDVFKPNPEEWLSMNPISKEEFKEIREWFNNNKCQEQLTAQLPEMPADMIAWFNTKNFDVVNSIYEMYEWTESINNPEIIIYKEIIPQLIYDIYENTYNNRIKNFNNEKIKENIKLYEYNNKIYILFEKFGEILILYNIYSGKPKLKDIISVTENYLYKNQEIDKNILKTYAKRAYPVYILADTSLWSNIQEDVVGNLALSPEQENLLKNCKFPLFINGQAGSGKSTMLFYLFAHIYFNHRKNTTKPLFLTYNNKLLENAKNSVKSILKNHPSFAEKYDTLYENEINELFFPFQSYLLDYILSDQDRIIFTNNKHISFYKFKKYYYDSKFKLGCKLKNKSKFSAELVWHVIRTYIKGSKLDEFSENDFDNLSKKDKSVSKEIFVEINDTIWKNWYSKFFDNYGLWDDQDLVRYILKKISIFPMRSLIFCDEAQDFTRNEIELILKITSFSQYDLINHTNIPLSFAGDPYQTINPTGFRWESLQEIFLEKFNQLTKRKNIKIFFKSLTQNYRSKSAIIKFANFIQGFRLKYLEINELEPQQAYKKIDGLNPCLFVLNENISYNELKDITKNTIYIIPCDEGIISEKEFIKNDEFLSKFVDIEEGFEKPVANVLSTGSVKGLEFDKIIVYKFGVSCPKSFNKVLQGIELNDSEYIELSHFFNKLYVGITRAKDYLFILDDKEGREKFWKFFENTKILDDLLIKKDVWKTEDLKPLILGTDMDIHFMKESDPLKVAKEFEESGMFDKNPDNLIRAEAYYFLAGDKEKAKTCKAFAYYYSEKYLEAGLLFKEINKLDDALRSFWKGMNWIEISNLDYYSNIIWKIIADYMLGINDISMIYNSPEFIEKFDRKDNTFMAVIEKIKKDLRITSMETLEKANFSKKIAEKGCEEFFELAANFYFDENLYQLAVDCWERIGNTQHTNYYKSKLKVSTEVNDTIKWLYKLNMPEEILKFINSSDLDSESHNYIFFSLLSKEKVNQALKYHYIPIKQRIEKIIKTINGNIQFQISILDYILNDIEVYAECNDLIRHNINFFEESIRSKDFIKAIISSSNFEIVTKDFIEILQKKTNFKTISYLTNILCNQIEQYNAEKLYFYIEIINMESASSLNNNLKILKSFAKIDGSKRKINFGDEESELKSRRLITNLINNYIWKNTEWQSLKIITIKEIAMALFNCYKELEDILFILEYIIDYEPHYSKWAKEKWLYYKELQLNYEINKSMDELKNHKLELELMEDTKNEDRTFNKNEIKFYNRAEEIDSSANKIREQIIQKRKEWGYDCPNSVFEKSKHDKEDNLD